MDVTSPIIPVPGVGAFDEESCRYFLQEIGEQIVPFFPFMFGIGEVHTLLLERYGEDWVADALSVLHELMEAEDNANGLGDDGDIFRSWRHSWRHRNDDPSNSFRPTVRGFILPEPTPQDRRRDRAASFSTWVAAPLEASDELPDHSRNPPDAVRESHNTLLQATFSTISESSLGRIVQVPKPAGEWSPENARYRPGKDEVPGRGYVIDSDEEDTDSQQDFEEFQDSENSTDFDNSQLISFEILTPSSDLRGGDRKIVTLRPIRTARIRERSPLSIKHQQKTSQNTSCQDSDPSTVASSSLAIDPFSISSSPWTTCLSDTVFDGDTTADAGNANHAELVQHPPKLPASAEAESRTPTTSRTNRHARLIDGAVITEKHCDLIDTASYHGGDLSATELRQSGVRASWRAVGQNKSSRHSLFQNIRGVFRQDQKAQHQHTVDQNKGQHPTSSLPHNAPYPGYDMPSPTPTVVNKSPDLSTEHHKGAHSFGLDGSFDEEPRLHKSCLNLNKELPASPGSQAVWKSSSSQTGTSSSDRLLSTPIKPSTSSSISSGISTASSKRDFRTLTRGLIDEDMSVRRPDLSPVREAETLLPTKFDNRKSMHSSIYSENSYKGTKRRSISIEDPVPLTPGVPLPLSVRKRDNVVMAPDVSQTLPSQSPSKSRRGNEEAAYLSPAPPRYNANSAKEVEFEQGTSTRGRTPRRPHSPGHTTQDVAEKPFQKRSRSPVKKFFGQFGKSTSLKNIAGEPRSKSKSASPEKSAPMKSWGSRFRHGFLTSDSDTEEQLNDSCTPPRQVTPSTPQGSKFPISLDPPYQAKMLSEIELVICFQANNFLMGEWRAGRLSDESIAKTKQTWTAKNRPQVLEFMYDQATQRDLIASNLRSVHFHGECAQNPLVLNATLYNWKSLAAEMAVRTFCSADSAIRKHMHDAHKIIEMLGAPPNTFLALQDLQVTTLAKINRKQRERIERYKEQEKLEDTSQQENSSKQMTPSKQSGSLGRRVDTPAPNFGQSSKINKSSVALNPSPGNGEAFETFENSRGGRLGMMVREMVKDEHQ